MFTAETCNENNTVLQLKDYMKGQIRSQHFVKIAKVLIASLASRSFKYEWFESMWYSRCVSIQKNWTIHKLVEILHVVHQDVTCTRPQEEILSKFNIEQEKSQK